MLFGRIGLAAILLLAASTSLASQPQVGSFGFDTQGMDRSVEPGADFYRYANGNWARTTAIPADKSNYGMFVLLDDLNRERVRALLDAARRDSKIGAAYASFLDEATVERRGLAPLAPWLNRIRAIKDRAGYQATIVEAARGGIGLPIALTVAQDDGAPDRYALYLSQAGLGMPDREYYLSDDAKMAASRTAYVEHLTRVFALLGEKDGARRAQALFDFEREIAAKSWSRSDSRDAARTYNPTKLQSLRNAGFDVAKLVGALGVRTEQVIVTQPDAVAAIAELIGTAPLAVLKDALLARSFDAYAAYLPRAFVEEDFAFHGKVLAGTQELEPRWKRAVAFATEMLPDEVSKLYVARWFPPATKQAADAMVRNIIAAMDRRIDRLDWMSDATKQRAHAKLAAFRPKIGYPDRWHDYTGLEMRADDLLGNAMRGKRFEIAYRLGKVGRKMDRWEWNATPMTVDAFANYPAVEIVFPAAVLQPPFFDAAADPAVNYGGIGAAIGHELSHHFDDQGSKYDATGRLANWWSADDLDRFHQRSAQLVRQYDAYEALPGLHVNGTLTLGENIADLAGLTVAYDAYRASLNGAAPEIDGTTGDQRFFLGFAQIWRLNYREAELRKRVVTNPHAPSVQRVWTVRNLDPWYEAFGVRAGEALYLDPAQRVRIW